jgi:predicted transport protein
MISLVPCQRHTKSHEKVQITTPTQAKIRLPKINISLSDRIALLSSAVVIGLGIWNIKLENRLARIEMNEFDPRLSVWTNVKADLNDDSTGYIWYVTNLGRKAAEDVYIAVHTSENLPLICVVGDRGITIPPIEEELPEPELPYARTIHTYSNISIFAQDFTVVICQSKSGSRSEFWDKYGVYPDHFSSSYNCLGFDKEHPSYQLPYLHIRGRNVEGTKIDYCGGEFDY